LSTRRQPPIFKDHFSGHAADYARYRPDYPAALFETLARLAPRRRLAWDCGTGSGQAAHGLVSHFREVIATDASAGQLAQARPAEGLEFRLAPAERSGLADGSVDLVTVAQAIHWFDLERFFSEATRVLRAGGVLAFWAYSRLEVDAEVDAVITHFYRDIVGRYWPPERRMVENGYRDIRTPFESLKAPVFTARAHWDLASLSGYLGTWSASRRYQEATGREPLAEIRDRLREAWGEPHQRRVLRWPITLRVCRKPG
jgi:SAM-dependent methyltransferase